MFLPVMITVIGIPIFLIWGIKKSMRGAAESSSVLNRQRRNEKQRHMQTDFERAFSYSTEEIRQIDEYVEDESNHQAVMDELMCSLKEVYGSNIPKFLCEFASGDFRKDPPGGLSGSYSFLTARILAARKGMILGDHMSIDSRVRAKDDKVDVQGVTNQMEYMNWLQAEFNNHKVGAPVEIIYNLGYDSKAYDHERYTKEKIPLRFDGEYLYRPTYCGVLLTADGEWHDDTFYEYPNGDRTRLKMTKITR